MEVTVREGGAVNIHMFCAHRPGLLLSTMRAMDSLGLDVQQAVISCFNGFSLDVFRAEVCSFVYPVPCFTSMFPFLFPCFILLCLPLIFVRAIAHCTMARMKWKAGVLVATRWLVEICMIPQFGYFPFAPETILGEVWIHSVWILIPLTWTQQSTASTITSSKPIVNYLKEI